MRVWLPTGIIGVPVLQGVNTGCRTTLIFLRIEFWGTFLQGVKRSGREADHSPPPSVEVKNSRYCVFTPQRAWPSTAMWPLLFYRAIDCNIFGSLHLLGHNKTQTKLLGSQNYSEIQIGDYSSTAGRDTTVGITTACVLGGPGIEFRWMQVFPHSSRRALGPT
jgi:hypothetical protein